VSAGWIAGGVRARALAGQHRDRDQARRLAACTSLGDALRELGATRYGRQAPAAATLAAAQQAIAGAVLWDMRVLAGWLPQGGAHLVRVLAGWFEIANTDELLQSLAGQPAAADSPAGAGGPVDHHQ
jgi:hypothetical protein